VRGRLSVASQAGVGWVETNIAYGPDGFAESPVSLIPPVNGYYCNLGTFTSEPQAGFTLPAPLPVGTPFMQIVVSWNEPGVCLTGMTDAGPIEFGFWIPEPSIVALLAAGAVCVVGFRRRRKRSG
jgi:hypothetical protein